MRFRAGASDGTGGDVGGGDAITQLRQPYGLRADAARRIKNGASGRNAEFGEHGSDAATLAANARLPVRVEQMVKRSEPVVEILRHRDTRPLGTGLTEDAP